MAHFAKLDENNIVLQVIVVGNDVSQTEEEGIAWCQKFSGHLNWKQCSYNTHGNVYYVGTQIGSDQSKAFRKNYPGKGYFYNVELDAFISPKTYDSWTLDNEKGIWIPPIPRPEEGPGLPIHEWNETSKSWQIKVDF